MRRQTSTPAQIYLLTFLYFVVLVMLNLLIALMGDSYDRVRGWSNLFVALDREVLIYVRIVRSQKTKL